MSAHIAAQAVRDGSGEEPLNQETATAGSTIMGRDMTTAMGLGASALLARWAATWGLPKLATRTRVEVNPRLRRSLARCRPVAGVIQLSPRVVAGDGRRLFAEALCHEFAHLAVRTRHRRRTAPH